ncbi:DUF3219 family protein [Bacillus yapensis]|uniref:DUF3219 family protein n=1 Tax=Bacillaceae TaxID=186817 RepID=UPI003CCC5E83
MFLDGRKIKAHTYEELNQNGKHKIKVQFHVKTEEYHEVTTLLYKGSFQVEVPQHNLNFHGEIQEYSTSITNLYEENQVGDFLLVLIEVR